MKHVEMEKVVAETPRMVAVVRLTSDKSYLSIMYGVRVGSEFEVVDATTMRGPIPLDGHLHLQRKFRQWHMANTVRWLEFVEYREAA